jgi:predicted transcriptional regulator
LAYCEIEQEREPEFPEARMCDVMAKNVLTISPRLTIMDALKVMMDKGFDQLPIVEDDQSIGMITWREIAEGSSCWTGTQGRFGLRIP